MTGSWGETVDWPLEYFCDQLCQDLFSSSWEVRHGSATALREVIRICGKGAGRASDIPQDQVYFIIKIEFIAPTSIHLTLHLFNKIDFT